MCVYLSIEIWNCSCRRTFLKSSETNQESTLLKQRSKPFPTSYSVLFHFAQPSRSQNLNENLSIPPRPRPFTKKLSTFRHISAHFSRLYPKTLIKTFVGKHFVKLQLTYVISFGLISLSAARRSLFFVSLFHAAAAHTHFGVLPSRGKNYHLKVSCS